MALEANLELAHIASLSHGIEDVTSTALWILQEHN